MLYPPSLWSLPEHRKHTHHTTCLLRALSLNQRDARPGGVTSLFYHLAGPPGSLERPRPLAAPPVNTALPFVPTRGQVCRLEHDTTHTCGIVASSCGAALEPACPHVVPLHMTRPPRVCLSHQTPSTGLPLSSASQRLSHASHAPVRPDRPSPHSVPTYHAVLVDYIHEPPACIPIVPNPPYFPAHCTYPTVAPQPSAASREGSLARRPHLTRCVSPGTPRPSGSPCPRSRRVGPQYCMRHYLDAKTLCISHY